MIRPVPDACINFLKDPEIENLVLHPYLDQKGKWTFGIGHKILPNENYPYNGAYPATPPIVLQWNLFTSPPINPKAWIDLSEEYAVNVCKADLLLAAAAVCTSVFTCAMLSENQYAALIIFAYNIGTFAFSTSGAVKALNAGRLDDFMVRWSQWNKIEDPLTKQLVISNGLVKRRRLEQQLYLKAV